MLIFCDCEAVGGCPATGRLTEFGAVAFSGPAVTPHCPICASSTRPWFHGLILPSDPSPESPAVPHPRIQLSDEEYQRKAAEVFSEFTQWLKQVSKDQPVFLSDNNGFDWMWICDGFHRYLGANPFGHSSRRISDYYAGLIGNFGETQRWKRLRPIVHDHHPVHDAAGNCLAFQRILNGER